MTKESANKWWLEIEALRAGKTIQVWDKVRDAWKDSDNPAFDDDWQYRVKPALPAPLGPRELWLVKGNDGDWCQLYTSETAAKHQFELIKSGCRHYYQIMHVRECS